jgi:hypothetical protein
MEIFEENIFIYERESNKEFGKKLIIAGFRYFNSLSSINRITILGKIM